MTIQNFSTNVNEAGSDSYKLHSELVQQGYKLQDGKTQSPHVHANLRAFSTEHPGAVESLTTHAGPSMEAGNHKSEDLLKGLQNNRSLKKQSPERDGGNMPENSPNEGCRP